MDSVSQVAADIRSKLTLDSAKQESFRSHDAARSYLIKAIEDLGVLVMVNGVVGNNTHRKLNPDEFRGFAIADPQAPLIFVNGADAKSAQVFTLIHELAHIWVGDTALSEADVSARHGQAEELWANKVAAEVLVPQAELTRKWPASNDLDALEGLALRFNVSTLVVLKRAFDLGLMPWNVYRDRYETQLRRIGQRSGSANRGSGGNFYYTHPLRISRNFAMAVISDTREGRTLFRDAFASLGTAKRETFERLAETVMP
jgi:Zn-dependent peptidase ImmA (M78 family)